MHARLVKTDGLTQQVLEAGSGPLVLLIHGFPELGISWRAQVRALADAGYHAVAPDMRGYGGTEKPERTDQHTILHLVGDMVDLVRALGETECVVIGHDWGAPVAWHCALMRPDMFSAVAGLSVPFQPRRPGGPPTEAMAAITQRAGLGDLYIVRFQNPDAHQEWDADPEAAQRKAFYGYDGATPADRRASGFLKPGVSMLQSVPDNAQRPPWLTAQHLGEYVQAFRAGGYKGPIDWYRCLDLNWSLTAFLQDRRIEVPALFVVGENDPVRNYAGLAEAGLKDWLTDLRGQHVIPGAGHWLQQECPNPVNRLLLDFLTAVSAEQ
jgi:pimeloyl-ACP methyl ester carboxylesterase